MGRPWDATRRAVHLDQISNRQSSALHAVLQKYRDEGFLSFFRNPAAMLHADASGGGHRRLYTLLRTLGRVGPWGVGFLVWEAYGPGLNS